MEKRLKNYLKYMEELLGKIEKGTMCKSADEPGAQENPTQNREQLIKEHLTQISFFQHERLIHLIVTVAFALLEMLSLIIVFIAPGPFTLLLTIVVLILLIPYIRHYYILENGVQKMYEQYDRLL